MAGSLATAPVAEPWRLVRSVVTQDRLLARQLVLPKKPHRARQAVGAVVAVAHRVLVQVLLVVALRVVELADRGRQLGGDLPVAVVGEDLLERVVGGPRRRLLLRGGPVDRRAVLRAAVVALTIQGGGVVVLPERLEQRLRVGPGAVICDEHRLRVTGATGAHLLIRRVWRLS